MRTIEDALYAVKKAKFDGWVVKDLPDTKERMVSVFLPPKQVVKIAKNFWEYRYLHEHIFSVYLRTTSTVSQLHAYDAGGAAIQLKKWDETKVKCWLFATYLQSTSSDNFEAKSWYEAIYKYSLEQGLPKYDKSLDVFYNHIKLIYQDRPVVTQELRKTFKTLIDEAEWTEENVLAIFREVLSEKVLKA